MEEKINKQKINLTNIVNGGIPTTIHRYRIILPSDSALHDIENSRSETLPTVGELFDVDVLDKERDRIVSILRRRGYYNFQKELLYFEADSALKDHRINLTLKLQPAFANNDSAVQIIFSQKRIGNITIYNIPESAIIYNAKHLALDTVYQDGFTIIYPDSIHPFRARPLISKIFLKSDAIYNERMVDRTYSALNSLSAVKYVSVAFKDVGENTLDCNIVVNQDMPHSIMAEVGGTNSDGDLGVGIGLGYQNNNIFRGFETFSIGVNGSYEAMGNLGQLFNATEVGGSAGLQFPRLLMPGSTDFKRRVGGTTDLTVSINYQQRPQYKRILANAGLKYIWHIKRTQIGRASCRERVSSPV